MLGTRIAIPQQQEREASAQGLDGTHGQVRQQAPSSPIQELPAESRAHESSSNSDMCPPPFSTSKSPSMTAKEQVALADAEAIQLDAQRREAALVKYKKLREEFFPEVDDISGEELLEFVQKNAIGDSVILVDCRSEAERHVSVYKGAVTISEFEANIESFKEKLIVAYCAIGRRSGMFLKKLLEQYPGIKVRNHAGSVVDWAHVGGPFVDQTTGTPTNRVHPNGTWLPYLPMTRNLQVVS
ncbi:hypothetical protein MPTK1_4g02090 [Marchantia polymorpha subsp. ruderalis]|uniref:Rhodanese domain-containing protein n=2 Tax=Marchantia polymorpha TaxID=3197 RepID=A0AAF6B5E6_MARPO|nr:hypothetical protein MARPO_0080s0090 [Marchantia polymorpha]PTQ34476.1 hypothetical protein MARPO_0080s0090 [Marchantia polymorpha]BBN07230.1 hypothetical protein Mp_4g02090 [Marchantia polymorpha subsp. ruderalis]BBN07231.1 hypothetical protein Mp_4g02090 [Marchantia polymorpha subsp. ruderalis]|eukprot:PTQ34475.1 hypothetical protein MARPO_0080s0090 [Marchantia polymorpha]